MTTDRRVRRRFMRQVARDQAGALAAAFGAGVVRQVGFLALPWTLQHALDDGLVADDRTALAWWTFALVAAGIVQVLGVCLWDWWSNVADGRAGLRLRAMLADRVVAGGDAGVGSGDLILRSGRDVDLVRVWVHGLATWAVIGTTVVVLVPGLFALSPLLLMVAAATVPCLLAVALVHPRRYEAAAELAAAAHGHRADHVEYAVASAVTSRGIGGGEVLARRHHDASAALTRHTVAASDRLARWQAWGNGIPTIAVAVGVLVGVPQVINGGLTVGGLVAFSAWMGTIGVAIDVGLARVAQTLEARVAVDRLVAVLDAPQEADHGDADAVVRQRAEPGRLVALTGPTGCGKSTVLQHWAQREPEAFLVPQRPLVLAGSVRLNLSLGDDVPDERLRAALADVALSDELDLDDHLDGADGLSGGQVQRLALARALVADPRVLLLDDVTSAVDASTEASIVGALRRRAADRVTVVVSHRPGVLAAADDVVEMAAVSR